MTKKETLEQLLEIWESYNCKDMRLGQLLINSIKEKNINSQINDLFYIKDEDLLRYCSVFKYSGWFCCGLDHIIFSGESFDNAYLYVCKKCKKEGSVELINTSIYNINRKEYLEVIKEKHPRSSSIPVLLKKCATVK